MTIYAHKDSHFKMYKILVSDKLGQSGLDLLAQMEDISYDMKLGLSKEELINTIPDYDGLIIRSDTRPDADVIAAGTKLKAIGRAGIGVDNIDLAAASAHKVVVMNTPRANSITTAEQTMALMLSTSRHTAASHASVMAGKWERAKFVGVEINNKVLGIIGLGYIGRLVATRAQAFGMTVVAYDPYVTAETGRELNIEMMALDDLLAQSDYITLHTIVNAETTKMINADALSKMKSSAILINVARGKLIDEEALATALKEGQIAAAGLDVFYSEPPTGSPLIGLPNVTHTPHLGASSKEAQQAVGTQIAQQVSDVVRGLAPQNQVNKF